MPASFECNPSLTISKLIKTVCTSFSTGLFRMIVARSTTVAPSLLPPAPHSTLSLATQTILGPNKQRTPTHQATHIVPRHPAFLPWSGSGSQRACRPQSLARAIKHILARLGRTMHVKDVTMLNDLHVNTSHLKELRKF